MTNKAFDLPTNRKDLVRACLDIIEQCRTSSGQRAAYCRQINAMIETGRQDGTRSLVNKLFAHCDRLASHLFSPERLKLTMEFENEYPKEILLRGERAARLITRTWEKSNLDLTFAQGVFEAVKFGTVLMKQWVEYQGRREMPIIHHSLVMPWQFGVYREDISDLDRQPAFCETVYLSMPEVWHRLQTSYADNLGEAAELFRRIKAHAERGKGTDLYNSFFHQVLSTGQLNTGVVGNTRPVPGGIVSLNNDPNYAIIGPQVDVDMVPWHELWMWDGEKRICYTIVEPDILVEPRDRRARNLLIDHGPGVTLHPYTKICVNDTWGYFWGRSEIVDLIEPQGLLSVWCDDAKRLMGIQFDKFLAFSGYDGVTDEVYGMARLGGYLNMPMGASVNDLTPKFPPETVPMLEFLMRIIDQLGGFDNILSGQNEQGVRAGSHANTLLKTASPRLRDRSLLAERHCAATADLTWGVRQAKDPCNYWTDPTSIETIDKTSFKLTDVPEDGQIVVDSHSSSPIFQDDHAAWVQAGVKDGFVDGESAIEMSPLPNKELLLQRYREKTAREQKLIDMALQRDPDAALEILKGARSHHK